MSEVSFVVATFRRPESLRATLTSLQAVRPQAEVVVVDDSGGDPATRRVVRACAEPGQVKYVSQSRRGAAAARNAGARAANGTLLIFCDDDVLVEPDHAERQLAAQAALPAGVVSGVSLFAPEVAARLAGSSFGRLRLEWERGYERDADRRPLGRGRYEARFLSARNLAIPAAAFAALQGFDERYPYAGAEDQDFSIRARRSGLLLVRDHNIRVVNNESILSLRDFCDREERMAVTAVILARRFPDEAGNRPLIVENRPIARRDPPVRVLKKLLKTLLSRRPVLSLAHGVISRACRLLPAGDRLLHPVFRGLVGLHIFRGVRSGYVAGEGR